MPLIQTTRGPEKGPGVFIAIPTPDKVHVPCMLAVMEGATLLSAAGFTWNLCIEQGNCHVDDARNSLVTEFLSSDADMLVFIDSDVGFKGADLLRLVQADRDIVGGVYPKKQDEEDFPVLTEGTLQAEADGCVKVLGAPTGFLKIHRRVFDALKPSLPTFTSGRTYTLFFERELAEGKRWSGDYNFCRRARKAGFDIWVLPEFAFLHEGTKAWSGTLGDFWRRKHGVDKLLAAQAFRRAIEACKAGNPTPEHFVALYDGWSNEWAAKPEFLAVAYELAKEAGEVLECGSGLTTLVMATVAKVTALEHDPLWHKQVTHALREFGLDAEVKYAPIQEGWYSTTPDAKPLVVIDGPPRAISDRSEGFRYSTKKLLVDDMDDPIQQANLSGWHHTLHGTFAIGVKHGYCRNDHSTGDAIVAGH